MFSETLGNVTFFILALTWTIYLVQEIFISGVAILNTSLVKNEEERKKLQVISGLHFDGMEVWLIAAIALTEGGFPLAFGTIFTYLYVVMFLLLFTIIGRGVSVEVIYKLDSLKWQKSMIIMWVVSSIGIMFLLGAYISNLFLGFPIDSTGLVGGPFSVLNVTGISGGLLFVALSLVAGSGWIYLLLDGDLKERGLRFVKKTGVIYSVPILTLLAFMGMNTGTQSSVWGGELYLSYPFLYVLPFLSVVAGVMVFFYGYNQKGKHMFIASLLVMLFFVVSGFVGTFPNVVASKIDPMYSITVTDAMSSVKGLRVIVIAVGIFYPVIIGYQTWKYKKFWNTVKEINE